MKRSKLNGSGTKTIGRYPDLSQAALGIKEKVTGPSASSHFFSDASPDCSDRSGTLPVPSSKVRGNAPIQRSALARSTTRGLVLKISAFMRSTAARILGGNRLILRLDCSLNGSTETVGIENAGNLKIYDFDVVEGPEIIRKKGLKGVYDLVAVFTDSSGILLSKNFRCSIGDDPLEILRNIKITRAANLIEKRQHGLRRNAIGKADSDGDRLVIKCVHRKLVESESVQRHL